MSTMNTSDPTQPDYVREEVRDALPDLQLIADLLAGTRAIDSAIHAVRWRPMRGGRLAVPPAPGMRPYLSSGSWNQAVGVAVGRCAKAAISAPAPIAAP